jgi:hypothetical protein
MDCMNLFLDILVAFGTLAVVVLAIWGEKIRAKLTPAKLSIRPHTLKGDPTVLKTAVQGDGGVKVMYYHLKVVNERRWLPAQDCRVSLTGLSRRGPDGKFHAVPMAVPLPFNWAPAPHTPARVTVTKEQVFDFGSLQEGATRFVPALTYITHNFQGYVQKGEAVRFFVEIDAANFISSSPAVFEVAWDGAWSAEPEQMQHHLRITEVNER